MSPARRVSLFVTSVAVVVTAACSTKPQQLQVANGDILTTPVRVDSVWVIGPGGHYALAIAAPDDFKLYPGDSIGIVKSIDRREQIGFV
jgi:hypothetical protein